MKALSIKQPWAWLICAGYKDVENRDWKIGRKPALGGRFQNRGIELPARIYVHAGKVFDYDAGFVPKLDFTTARMENLHKLYNQLTQEAKATLMLLPLWWKDGAIIGEVDITDCVTKSDSPWFEGRYGFTLANPVLYDKPISYRGQPGFFEVDLKAGASG